MPFPIGVSGGDFVAYIQLIRTVIKALKDSAGAGEQFRTLTTSLSSLERALSCIDKLEVSYVNHLVALKSASVQCQATIHAFLHRSEKYHPRLRIGGVGMRCSIP